MNFIEYTVKKAYSNLHFISKLYNLNMPNQMYQKFTKNEYTEFRKTESLVPL